MKLILVGRSGSGKTSVVESLLGSSPILPKAYMHEITRLSSPVTVAETVGFFSKDHNLHACTKKLTESVHSFAPGPDAFGLVIKIGRFTQEQRQMVDIFRKTFGEDVFHFTILIFTRLDDLLYDHVSLDKFLEDSTPELKEILDLCSGRYIGFDNSVSWEARTGYAQSLVTIMKTMQMKNNNVVYTTDLLDKANALKMKETEDELRRKEESTRQMKEVIKASMRPELQEQIRKDTNEKFEIEEQQRKMRAHKFPEDRNLLKYQEPQIGLSVKAQGQQMIDKHSDVYSDRNIQKADKVSSPKKEKNNTKVKGPKPEVKPKPKTMKKSDKEAPKKSCLGRNERSSSTSKTTPRATERGAARPRRSGCMGRVIDFFEGLGS